MAIEPANFGHIEDICIIETFPWPTAAKIAIWSQGLDYGGFQVSKLIAKTTAETMLPGWCFQSSDLAVAIAAMD